MVGGGVVGGGVVGGGVVGGGVVGGGWTTLAISSTMPLVA